MIDGGLDECVDFEDSVRGVVCGAGCLSGFRNVTLKFFLHDDSS